MHRFGAFLVQRGTGTGDVLPAYKVNDQLVRWAQIRADEVAQRAASSPQDKYLRDLNTYNGAPEWAKQSLSQNPQYAEGTYIFGPEYIWEDTLGCELLTSYRFVTPLTGGDPRSRFYFTVNSQLANVAGIGMSRIPSGPHAGKYVVVLEIAYSDGSQAHGNTTTVAEARAALDAESDVRIDVKPESCTDTTQPENQPDVKPNEGTDVMPDGDAHIGSVAPQSENEGASSTEGPNAQKSSSHKAGVSTAQKSRGAAVLAQTGSAAGSAVLLGGIFATVGIAGSVAIRRYRR